MMAWDSKVRALREEGAKWSWSDKEKQTGHFSISMFWEEGETAMDTQEGYQGE